MCVPPPELKRCLVHARRAGSHSAFHVCSRNAQAKYRVAGGALGSIPAHALDSSCQHTVGFGAEWTASAEALKLRAGGHATQLDGLSAAIYPSGAVVCGPAANDALATQSTGHSARRGGLVMIHSHRQVASEYAVSAHVLGMSASHHRVLHRASLLLVNANPSTPTPSLIRWLGWYEGFQHGLRLLIHTRANLGYSCGELHTIAATVKVWSHFPWVMALSGPDVLALPREFEILQPLLDQVRAEQAAAGSGGTGACAGTSHGGGPWEAERTLERTSADASVGRALSAPPRNLATGALRGRLQALATASGAPGTTALLYDLFRVSRNDPLSFKEIRYNMDAFVYFPCRWRAAGGDLEAHPLRRSPRGHHSLWDSAAAHCVNQTRNRPEAILHVVQQQHNLSVRLIGNGSRGSLIDIHKAVATEPDGGIWHCHATTNALRWLQTSKAPPNAFNIEPLNTASLNGTVERVDSKCPCIEWELPSGRKSVQC
jgi:hypothetical protein